MARKGGLGKGLDSLIPSGMNLTVNRKNSGEETAAEAKTQEPVKEKKVTIEVKKPAKAEKKAHISDAQIDKNILYVNILKVEPNRDQPRKQFDEEALNELASSIKQYGVLQPLLVQKNNDYFEIIAGERRWRASKLAGLKEIPVMVKEYTPQEVMEISLIENIQREDLNPIEEASAYERLIEDFHMKHDEIAAKVSKSRTAITNSMRLLKLDKRVQLMLVENELTSGHARALLALESKDAQFETAEKVVEHKLSVRETEKLVKALVNPKPEKIISEIDAQTEIIYKNIEEQIREALNTKVNIHRKDENRGKIEIEYYSMDELERLMYLLKSK